MSRFKALSGNEAVATAMRQINPDVVAAYPITPQTHIVEAISQYCSDGRLDARFLCVESEHSAMAAVIGAASGGARAFTASSSHGLAYMHELLHWASAARLPIVMAEVNRALGPGWNIWLDQTDSLSQRDTGWIQLYCEDSQDALDTTLIAYRLAESVNLPVMVHAHGDEGARAAVLAGARSIEHGTYTGPRAIRLFKETGAYLVPTLLAGKTVASLAVEADFMAPEVREKAMRVGNDMAGNFEKAHKAGVRVAYGTDSGISPHGTNAEEAVLMVEAGMSEMDVLVAATVNAADLVDMSDSIGTIEAGKFADIIAVDGSPLVDISELLDVDFVMKGGKVYKQ